MLHGPSCPDGHWCSRAVAWATDALERFDTSDSALVLQLGVSWHTTWNAILPDPDPRTGSTDRLRGINASGRISMKWSRTGPPGAGMVSGIIEYTRDADGEVRACLLDLVEGR
ncbi:hypothetical protein [Arthrobacter sp. VKM Ac-2550]|uniref:hypothetical protein n=1 Tax=Crystallibacter permensis TaxID=1938888 RepID=UPI00222688CE|nr:hypothetical protein [Arthrobacter sp. VKM Ac-2550]MCW2135346.1 hypothetical protein [Arthrobacter sp. VKM Ac-2550]